MTPLDFIRRRPALVGYIVLGVGLVTGFLVNEDHNQAAREAVVKSGQAVAIVGCNRDYDQAVRFRHGLRDDRRESLKQLALFVREGTLTEAQGRRAFRVTNKQTRERLDQTPLPDCRAPLSILTGDPDADIFVPDPKYPGYKQDG